MMTYQEFFQLTASSSQELRFIVADYLLDQGNESLATSTRLGLEESDEKICDEKNTYGNGIGDGRGLGLIYDNGSGYGWGEGSGSGGGWGGGGH